MSSENNYPWFFFYRVGRLSLLVFLPTIFLILFFYRSSYKNGLVFQVTVQIEESLKNVEATLKTAGMSWNDWCQKLPPSDVARYTLVSKEGKILCDTQKEKVGETLHDPQEIETAFEKGFGASVRYSDIFGTQSVFAGLKINDVTAIRKAVPLSSLKDNMNRFDRVIFFRIVPIAFLSYVIFLFFFYRDTRPLGNILAKVEQFKMGIPFKKNLRLLYKRDQWGLIEEALKEADSQLKIQISQVKNENEKIAAILEAINDKIIAIDPFETVLFYNSKFKNSFMKERQSQEILPKIWHTIRDERVLEIFRDVLKNGETESLKGLRSISPANPDRYFDLKVTPLRNTDGKITGALGVFYDVTEFKLTEQMRVDFVANVSHEIRTPLTSVKGYTQVLESQKDKVHPDLHAFLEKIVSNTERMISLFNDLLNLSVIEAQGIMKFEPLVLAELVDEVSHNIMTNYPSKKIEIKKDLRIETIKGDQRLIEQVLSNLMDNACKYSGDAISICISSHSENEKAYISVSDNGPGIPKEHIQRIFERFYRIDTSRESSRGTGLGLSIVKHIIAKHGGKIWAESETAQGTKFIIELPV